MRSFLFRATRSALDENGRAIVMNAMNCQISWVYTFIMTLFSDRFSQKKELFILVMMLETLHLTIWFDFGSTISRSLMLSHLGLFLLWQPVLRGDKKLSTEDLALFIVFTLILTVWLNLWLLFAWIILLIGFISGRITLHWNEKRIYIIALIYLVLELLFACVPKLANIKIGYDHSFKMLLPVLPILIFFFPVPKLKYQTYRVDFIHAITTSMLISLVAFGSLLNMFLGQTNYLIALTYTSTAIGGFIICISWLLTYQSRFGHIGQLWTSYMLNIGTPFEKWLSELSCPGKMKLSAEDFLHDGMQSLADLSWVSGIKWELNDVVKEAGNKTVNNVKISQQDLTVYIYTYGSIGTSLKLHSTLLINLLYNFYLGKQREQELMKQAYLKMIHETGARITHDIKNLLQSLQAITSIITHDSDKSSIATSQRVLKRQLPDLTKRLQLALDKLQAPKDQVSKKKYLKDWWDDLQKRNGHLQIKFQSDIDGNPTIPVDLFDNVTDNLLENIQTKKMSDNTISTIITITSDDTVSSLNICDTGSMIPEHISRELLNNVIESDNGLGIGLYQANQYAKLSGYRLSLIQNQPGRICFELSNIPMILENAYS